MAKATSVKHIVTKELPEQIRPRERLFSVGAANLSDSELLAIVLQTGTLGVSSLRLAEEILARFGNRLGKLGSTDSEELSTVAGIGKAKAAQLLAAVELGRRVVSEKARKRTILNTPQKVAELLMPKLRYLEREHFVAIIVNTKLQYLKTVDIAIGSMNSTIVQPRELYKRAIRANGAGIIVAHNHPSGEVEPSREDIIITRRLIEAGRILGIDFIDHIIIGDGQWLSLKEEGHIN